MKASPILSNFNAGQLSPLLEGRVDLGKYGSGSRRLENMVPTVQGPLGRRVGFRFVEPIRDDTISKVWLIPFQAAVGASYVIEAGPLYFRFFTNHGLVQAVPVAWDTLFNYSQGDVVVSGGVNYYAKQAGIAHSPASNPAYWFAMQGTAYEVPHSVIFADLTNSDGTCAFQFAQANDVLYLAHPKYFPSKLYRTGPGTFIWTPLGAGPEDVKEPFQPTSLGATSIYASADTGSVSLVASAPVFTADTLFRSFYIEQPTVLTLPQWEVGKTIAIGDRVRSGLNNYIALTAATTGTVKPTHTDGARTDGSPGVQWLFTDDGWGVVVITAIADNEHATATVTKRLPGTLVGSGTPSTRWAKAAWNALDGYPRAVCFFRGRLCWARGQTIWASVPDAYEDYTPMFGGAVTPDSALTATIAADEGDPINWMRALDQLIVGTASGEYAVGEVTTNDAFGPDNIKAARQSSYGSNGVGAIAVGDVLLFVQRSGRKLREAAFDIQSNSYASRDLTILAERITWPGLVQAAFARDPDAILWSVRSDGLLIGFTYNKEQDVFGWHPHPIGGPGYVESVCVVTAPTGTRDEVWAVIRRTIDGDTHRYVEYMGDALVATNLPQTVLSTDYSSTALRVWDAFYLDAGLSYDGTAATHFTGLDHLEGETVQILADGAPVADAVVDTGAIDLAIAAKVVHVGLHARAVYQSMRLNAGAADGTSQGKVAKLLSVAARVFETVGGKFGEDPDGDLDPLEYHHGNDAMDAAILPFTGDVMLRGAEGWTDQGKRIAIVQDQPLPLTLVAVMPQVNTQDSR